MDGADAPWVCSVCGERAAHWSDQPVRTEFRDGAYFVPGFTYEHCDACGESVFDASQVDDLLRAGVELARADLGRLSSDEIRVLRHEMGLTQGQLETQLGAGPGTVGRWERGTSLQTKMADSFLRVLAAHPEIVSENVALIAREGRGPYKKRAK